MGTVTIPEVVVTKETEKALLVRTEEGDEIWVPKSVVDEDSEVYQKGDEGTLTVQEWFVKKTDELRGYLE